ncbi:MAG: phosphatase PAP2 family protein [Bacteroidetes bacterium]|uniref:Phosphatase PAP2 family protein n=1 Tax=Candidatus Cryptobacteroides excrementipullorum TaxID=2840761 RepID=A0A9D9IST6_9BACT|nr:phosphatase PAP2 family protein [Candidatus Cryptobacteroides excrementipullorum]
MPANSSHIRTVAVCLAVCLAAITSHAQYRTTYGGPSAGTYSFDGGIRQLRYNAIPNFSSAYDDYLQYLPAAVMAGMKAAGYESRTCWGRMLVSDAFSTAVMAGLVNGVKYTVRRPRPDGSSDNSFPSGHTATAFMLATMLHKEYGWRSPWFSFGAYTAATATALGRVMNDRHWASDLVGGAVIGVAATQLGYLIADKIFKDRYLMDGYENPGFSYDPTLRHYEASVYFGYRIFPGNRKQSGTIPQSGSSAGLQANMPINPGSGFSIRASANSMIFSSGRSFNMYNVAAGGYWQWPFASILELETRLMLGYAWHREGSGIDIIAGPSLSVVTGNNFKIKAFAEYEAYTFTEDKNLVHSILAGFGATFFW